MNYIKDNGSINSGQIMDIMDRFSDLNSKESIESLGDNQYIKYMKFSLDAAKETLGRHRDGRFADESLEFPDSQGNTHKNSDDNYASMIYPSPNKPNKDGTGLGQE